MIMFKKESKVYSVLHSTCPSCHEGKMWNQHAYVLSKMTQMNKTCPHCHANLEPEPSFYTGGMYVGYAFTVAIVLITFAISLTFFEEPNISIMFWIVMLAVVLFAPMNLRLSRNIWAHTFIHYKKQQDA
jgi:uncharacterized protein (DUF983 family)